MAMFPTDRSSVTAAWLSEVLGADVRECRLVQIGIGVGLLGRLYRAHLKGDPDVPTSVVVKLPMLDARVRSEVCEDLEFYLREVRFYQEVGLANPLRPARPYFAAFDETTHDFVLVLEDLGRLRVADQIVGCTATDAETVIDAIARHHAHWWESDRFAERMRAAASRLAVANRASKIVEAGFLAMRSHDIDGLVAVYSDRFDYDDRRRLSGDPIDSPAALRAAAARIVEQYPNMECRILAVRGERLEMHRSRWSDDAGNETTYLHVVEIGDDGRITYDGRFDEDDFEGAYRELDRRYYAGEGATFAEGGAVATACMIALNQNDFDRLFGELSAPGLRIENRSRAAFPHRSTAEARATLEELNMMLTSARTWHAVVCWLSPTWVVLRQPREVIGPHGEDYAWVRVHVCEFRDRRLTSMCEFELDDEAAAFAYAEERMRATENND
jgi:hypothetical protein